MSTLQEVKYGGIFRNKLRIILRNFVQIICKISFKKSNHFEVGGGDEVYIAIIYVITFGI